MTARPDKCQHVLVSGHFYRPLTYFSPSRWEGEGDSSNMAVMEIELPSGFTVDEQSIPGLYKYRSVKRVETVEGDTKVIIYFDEVSRRAGQGVGCLSERGEGSGREILYR